MFFQLILWLLYLARALRECKRSLGSGLYHVLVLCFEVGIHIALLNSFSATPKKRQILIRNTSMTAVSWMFLSYIVISPSLTITKILSFLFKPGYWTSLFLRHGGMFITIRILGVWFGVLRYRRMKCDADLKVTDILAYSISSGVGIHLAAHLLDVGKSRKHFTESALRTAIIRFLRAILRQSFDLLQHLHLAMHYASQEMKWKFLSIPVGIITLLVTSCVFQALLRVPGVVLDMMVEYTATEPIAEELFEVALLFSFVSAFAAVCNRRYKQLKSVESNLEDLKAR